MTHDGMLLFDLDPHWRHGRRIATHLEIPVSPHEERRFEDGEMKVRPLISVRDRDVFVVQSLLGDAHDSVHDKLWRLLLFIGALKDSSARRVTVVAPYLAYSRKDRRTKSRDPVATRQLAILFEAAGVDRVVTMDVHNQAAFENAFRCRTEHLLARPLFADHVKATAGNDPIALVSPDVGGMKRVEQLHETLEHSLARPVGLAFMEKTRSAGVVGGGQLVGNVAGCRVLILDDLIATGTTMLRAAEACRTAGALSVVALATHGVFAPGAVEMLQSPAFDSVVVTDTVPPWRLEGDIAVRRLTVLDTTPLFAEAIARMHAGGSLSDLL
jgi:ribose-phosphate pyrophosphokinase